MTDVLQPPADTANYRDFTKKRPELFFDLNGERFYCRKALTPTKLQQAVRAFKSIKDEFFVTGTADDIDETNAPALLQKITGVLRHFMKKESYARLQIMLGESDDDDEEPDEPVDTEQLMEILSWVLSKTTGRPTPPSSDSTTTSPSDGTGTSSTAGAQREELIPSS